MPDDQSVFSPDELLRLIRLRDLRATGQWPPPVQLPFTARHGIHMSVTANEGPFPDRTLYHCTLHRSCLDADTRQFETRFQVMAVHPEPPGIDEVLRWLATTVAHVAVAGDLSGWALIHGYTANGGKDGQPYRGLVRDAISIDDFPRALQREADRFRVFLGPAAYAELLASVDAF